MNNQLVVPKNRTNIVPVSLGIDLSADTITSEIRVSEDPTSTLIATWAVTFNTDGTDGKVVLTLPVADVENITRTTGFMDLKRVSGGEPLSVFREPLEVVFQGVVTA